MRMLAVLVVLIGSLSSTAAGPATSSVAAQRQPLASTGYVLAGASDALVAREAHALATLGVDGVTLSRRGDRVSSIDPRLAGTAHAHGLRAELLLSNYSDRLGDFDPRAAALLLRSPANIDAVAGQLASYVATQGWDGIQLDLESLASADADGLLALATTLQSRMAPEKTVSIAVMASDRAAEYVSRGYRLPELGAVVDTLALMTYDQHGPWSGPGPIGALAWQRRSVGVVSTMVPAGKVDLGVAGYGYTWPRGRDGRTVTASRRGSWSPRTVRRPAGGPARASGPPGSRTAPGCGGPTDARSPCARTWPASSAYTASPCGGSARPTRWPEPQS